jgi:hypothetical protein
LFVFLAHDRVLALFVEHALHGQLQTECWRVCALAMRYRNSFSLVRVRFSGLS